MSDLKPIAHLVWGQYRRAADDVEDYYEVAYRPDHKSVDGSDPFPVWDCPPDVASLTAERDRLREENARFRGIMQSIKTYGELACVEVDRGFLRPSGKKPATKDVWQFTRHMLTAVDAALGGSNAD